MTIASTRAVTYSRGKLIGLITDRDIVVRGVAEGKECNNHSRRGHHVS